MPTTRYVKASAETFGTKAGGFTSPDSPARRLADALKVAADGDTIRILDTAVYAEGELVVDRPLTIESAAAATDPAFKPTDPAFKPNALPRIRPRADRGARVFRIQAAGKGRNLLKGPVVLRGLTIEGGLAKNTQDDRAFGHGGGIAIVDLDDVRIERCCIRDNKTELLPLDKLNTDEFKETVGKQVGLIVFAVLNQFPKVPGFDPMAQAVKAGKAARDAMDKKLEDRRDRRDNSRLAGQGSGGGACFVWSSGRMSDCLVRDNVVANGRGGGVAVVGFGWPTLDGCVIVKNTAGSQAGNRNDGGGIGLEIAVPDKVSRDLKESDMLAFAQRWLGKQLPSQLIKLAGEDGERAIATRDFDELLNVFLTKAARAFLVAERWNHWDAAAVKKAQTSQVVITNCTVKDNTARDDGGGLYASVLSRFRVEGSSFSDNTAEHGKGGGLRASMGSDAALSGVKVENNHTTGDLYDASGNKSAPGGGGIACRNVTLTLGGSKGGCSITKNTTKEWAGGGIIIEAASEGMLAGVPDLWHAILTEVFEVTKISATIDATTTVTDNIAGERGRVLESAKAGGLYILRSKFRAAPQLKVSIGQFHQNVCRNQGKAGTFVSKLTKKSIKAEQINLVDEHALVDDGDAEAGSHLAGTTFHYES